jgi:Fe2+ or Zn2+ uptake regulation protein
MKDQGSDLNQLIKKYKKTIIKLQTGIEETKRKMNTAYEALKLLEQEKMLKPTSYSFSFATESVSEKYKDMGLNKAILNVLKDNKDKYFSGQEIYEELIKEGFKSNSTDVKRDVYIALYRLLKTNKIIAKEVDKRKKYTSKETE